MYTLPKGTDMKMLSVSDIEKIIAYGKSLQERFTKLENYYLGVHDITGRKKNPGLSNNIVIVNHPKYIVDTNVGYLLGNPVDYQPTEGIDIEPVKDAYKKQTINDLDVEIARDCGIFGLQYEWLYANEDSEPKSAEVDNKQIVLVRDDTIEHNKLFAVMWRDIYQGDENKHDKLLYQEIVMVDKEIRRTYRLKNKQLEMIDEEEHVFGDVPVIEYRNNPDLKGDFEDVISLIDAYNILQSDRVNDKEQLVDAILVIHQMDFKDTDIDSLLEHRVIAGVPADAKVEYLVKNLNEADTDVLRQTIENDIHKISMVPNMSDENFIGNSSGVAIRYKLLAFEQNIKNKERYFEKGLMERFKMYNHYLMVKSNMQEVPTEEVDAVFKRNLPSNDLEISQMINNLSGMVDKETLIAQLSFVKDAKEIVALVEKENEIKEPEPQPEQMYEEIPDSNNTNNGIIN